MRTTQVTPGGIRVCGTGELTADELAAVDALGDWVKEREEARYAALSPEERAAEDERHERVQARIRARVARLRGEEP